MNLISCFRTSVVPRVGSTLSTQPSRAARRVTIRGASLEAQSGIGWASALSHFPYMNPRSLRFLEARRGILGCSTPLSRCVIGVFRRLHPLPGQEPRNTHHLFNGFVRLDGFSRPKPFRNQPFHHEDFRAAVRFEGGKPRKTHTIFNGFVCWLLSPVTPEDLGRWHPPSLVSHLSRFKGGKPTKTQPLFNGFVLDVCVLSSPKAKTATSKFPCGISLRAHVAGSRRKQTPYLMVRCRGFPLRSPGSNPRDDDCRPRLFPRGKQRPETCFL